MELSRFLLFIVLICGFSPFSYSKGEINTQRESLSNKECFVSSNLQRVFIRAIEDGQELETIYNQFLEKADKTNNELLRKHLVETHRILSSNQGPKEAQHVKDLYADCIKKIVVPEGMVIEQQCLRMADIQFEAYFRKVKGIPYASYINSLESKFSALPKKSALPKMLQLYKNLTKEIYETNRSIYDYAFETHVSCVHYGRNNRES